MAELNEKQSLTGAATKNEIRLVEEMIGIDENGKIDLTKLQQRLPDLKRILTNVVVKEKLLKHPMPEQDPVARASNFDEVALGYDAETAIAEAKRCLNCKKPMCRAGCPVSVRIPEFIAKVAEGDFDAGESVAIGRLERFVADYHMAKKDKPPVEVPPSNGHKVAIIGSGPAGLTCAGDVRKMGYDVTIFEAFHKSGGVLVYGIPQFRLPKEIVAAEIENLKALGVKIENNVIVGKSITIDELFEEGYEAVFIGSGAGLPQFLHIPGENLMGVYSANELLTRTNLMKAYRDDYDTPIKRFNKVAVVGAGNVAMDAARVAKRLGASEVHIVYRRSRTEMPARQEEVEHAEAEGIEFNLLNNPCAILGDENGHVIGLECVPQELGDPDARGRRTPIPKEEEKWVMDVDTVIIAIGTSPNPLIRSTTPGLTTTRKGGIDADDMAHTEKVAVFAGGDAVTGSATVILAMGAGKNAAYWIDEYIRRIHGEPPPPPQ